MSNVKELFVLDENTGYVDINKAWIQTIKEFKPLYSLKYNIQEGDHDGRKRIRCVKELTYMYHLIDYRSIFSDYEDSERERQARINAGLPESFTPSSTLNVACDRYKQLIESKIVKLYNSVNKSVFKMIDYYDNIDFMEKDEYGKHVYSIKEYSQVLKSLDGLLDSVESLEKRVKKNQSSGSRLQGDALKGMFEDPSAMNKI